MFVIKIVFILIKNFSIFNCYLNHLNFRNYDRIHFYKFCSNGKERINYEPTLENNCTVDCFYNLKRNCLSLVYNKIRKDCETFFSVCNALNINYNSSYSDLNLALPDERFNICFIRRFQDVRKEIKDYFRFRNFLNADFLWPYTSDDLNRYCFKISGWKTFPQAIGECSAYRLDLFQLSFTDEKDKIDSLKMIDYLWKSFELDHNTFIWYNMDRKIKQFKRTRRDNETVSVKFFRHITNIFEIRVN